VCSEIVEGPKPEENQRTTVNIEEMEKNESKEVYERMKYH